MNLYSMLNQYQQQPFARLQQDGPPVPQPYAASAVQAKVNQSWGGPTLRSGLNQFAANQGVAWNSPARVAEAAFQTGNALTRNLGAAASVYGQADQANAARALDVQSSLFNEMLGLSNLNQSAYELNAGVGRRQQSQLLQLIDPFFQAMRQYA